MIIRFSRPIPWRKKHNPRPILLRMVALKPERNQTHNQYVNDSESEQNYGKKRPEVSDQARENPLNLDR
jgi:hypothetical protein